MIKKSIEKKKHFWIFPLICYIKKVNGMLDKKFYDELSSKLKLIIMLGYNWFLFKIECIFLNFNTKPFIIFHNERLWFSHGMPMSLRGIRLTNVNCNMKKMISHWNWWVKIWSQCFLITINYLTSLICHAKDKFFLWQIFFLRKNLSNLIKEQQ